jgi:hypothetical protein
MELLQEYHRSDIGHSSWASTNTASASRSSASGRRRRRDDIGAPLDLLGQQFTPAGAGAGLTH